MLWPLWWRSPELPKMQYGLLRPEAMRLELEDGFRATVPSSGPGLSSLIRREHLQVVTTGLRRASELVQPATILPFANGYSLGYGQHGRMGVDRWGLEIDGLRELAALLGVRAISPGALAARVLRTTWTPGHAHAIPPAQCLRDIREHSPGARIENAEQGWRPLSLDMRNAFSSHLDRLPTGCAVRVFDEEAPTWFGLCDVRVPNGLALGMCAQRGEDGGWSWDGQGSMSTWLWSESACLVRELGGSVSLRSGWGWSNVTDCLVAARDLLWRALERAGTRSPALEAAVKRVLRALVGILEMRPTRYTVVPWEDGTAEDSYLYDEGFRPDVMGRAVAAVSGSPCHWAALIRARTANSLYRVALPLAEQGLVRGLHTDCVYLDEEVEAPPGWRIKRREPRLLAA